MVTSGTQKGHSNTQKEKKEEIGAVAPSISKAEKGKKSKPPSEPKPPKPKPEDRAAELVAKLTFPPAYDTPEVRAEFTRWVHFRAYEHRVKPPGDLVKYFQDQLGDVERAKPDGRYYIPHGVGGYLAALETSRREQWRHPYPDKDYKPDGATGRRDLSHVPLI